MRVVGAPLPPSESQLANATDLKLGEPFTPEKLGLAEQAVRRLLAESGFRRPTVTSAVVRDADAQQVNITFTVNPGLRARIGALLVAGENPPLSEEQIRAIGGWREGAATATTVSPKASRGSRSTFASRTTDG